MMNKKYLGIAVFLMAVSSLSFLYAVDSTGQVEFNIRFYDRRIYYIESAPILVQVTITNNSPAPYRFKLADDRAFSVDFEIRNMSNRPLPHSDSLIRKRTQNGQIFFREVSIESGESFSFTEDLRDYIAFGQPGSFRVRAHVYPELFRSAVVPAIESNYLNLSLRPELIYGNDGIPVQMDTATGAALVKQRIPPDETVSYMLTARQESHWERFFLYMDLETMLRRDPVMSRRYLNENEAGRQRMVSEYRRDLQNSIVDGDIVVIPTSFSILRTNYTNNEATVVVMQRYRMSNFTELRQYTYYLEKRDNFWIIINYTVQAMGTEANR